MVHPFSRADDSPLGPRASAWQRVEKALTEGKPKSAAEALAGIEESAATDKAWAEVARAIATRILTETGDRPGDDPERIVRLAAAAERAPAETRPVLEAIRANWTWDYFQMNRWRFQQRTAGGADAADLARIEDAYAITPAAVDRVINGLLASCPFTSRAEPQASHAA